LILSLLGVKGYSFQHAKGIYRKGTKEKVVSSPQEALELIEKIYRTPISVEEMRNFNSLYGWIEANLSEEDKNDVYSYYLKILDSTRGNKDPITGGQCGHIPVELEDFWRQNKDIIPLSGKFLCKDQKERLMGEETIDEEAKKWSEKYKRSINCSSPKGFSQKQYCKRQKRGGDYKS
jgi:hypothetical protein